MHVTYCYLEVIEASSDLVYGRPGVSAGTYRHNPDTTDGYRHVLSQLCKQTSRGEEWIVVLVEKGERNACTQTNINNNNNNNNDNNKNNNNNNKNKNNNK